MKGMEDTDSLRARGRKVFYLVLLVHSSTQLPGSMFSAGRFLSRKFSDPCMYASVAAKLSLASWVTFKVTQHDNKAVLDQITRPSTYLVFLYIHRTPAQDSGSFVNQPHRPILQAQNNPPADIV